MKLMQVTISVIGSKHEGMNVGRCSRLDEVPNLVQQAIEAMNLDMVGELREFRVEVLAQPEVV
jgi:hypothetical protein